MKPPSTCQPTKPKPVRTKHDFVRRYSAGEFGNASPTWNTFEEWCDRPVGLGALYHVRNRIAGGKTWYNVLSHQMYATWSSAVGEVGFNRLYISAMAPTEKTLFQGEVIQGFRGLDLTYTTVAKPMRTALREQTNNTQGIGALTLLRHFLCPRSWDWMVYLLDAYPNHAIEFSTYSVNWGTLPGYNTVFWEVRLY